MYLIINADVIVNVEIPNGPHKPFLFPPLKFPLEGVIEYIGFLFI